MTKPPFDIAEEQRRIAEKRAVGMMNLTQFRKKQTAKAKRWAFFWGFVFCWYLDHLIHLLHYGKVLIW
jgi:hypothetical protein